MRELESSDSRRQKLSRMMGERVGGRRNGEREFNGHKVSVWEGKFWRRMVVIVAQPCACT